MHGRAPCLRPDVTVGVRPWSGFRFERTSGKSRTQARVPMVRYPTNGPRCPRLILRPGRGPYACSPTPRRQRIDAMRGEQRCWVHRPRRDQLHLPLPQDNGKRSSRSSCPNCRRLPSVRNPGTAYKRNSACFVISRSAVRVRSPAPIESITYRDIQPGGGGLCQQHVPPFQPSVSVTPRDRPLANHLSKLGTKSGPAASANRPAGAVWLRRVPAVEVKPCDSMASRRLRSRALVGPDAGQRRRGCC